MRRHPRNDRPVATTRCAIVAGAVALSTAVPGVSVTWAQSRGAEEGRRRALAARVPEDARITIDGRLDEPAWAEAAPAGGFIQQQPDEGQPATEQTEIRFLYDDEMLYVGGILHDSDPQRVITNELKRDFAARDGDLFVLVLDTFNDRRNSYGFQTNPMGAQREIQAFDDGRTTNQNWDTVWFLKTSMFESGWTLEFAIPFKSIRFPSADRLTWGLNIFRLIRRKNETTVWSPVPRQYNQFKVSYAGTLTGIAGVAPGRNVRIKPFAIGSTSRGRGGTASTADGGVDVKVGLGSSFVADASYRTDFSQVEADERQINLTRFSLFLPEKREFFLENQGAFQVGPLPSTQTSGAQSSSPPDMVPFFSRRIGLNSNGQPVPMLGGLRLTGKVTRTNLAFLNAHTDRAGDTPSANFTVARLNQEFLSNSTAGLFYFGREEPSYSNRLAGGDVRLNLRRAVDVDALLMQSSTTAIGRDTAWRLGFGYDRDRDKYTVSYLSLGRNFRDELGFIPRLGVEILSASGARRLRPKVPGSLIREYRPELSMVRITRTSGGVDSSTLSPAFHVEVRDGSTASVTHRRYRESLLEPFPIRPDYSISSGDYEFAETEVNVTSSRARRISFTAAVRAGGFWDGDRRGYSGGLRFRYNAHIAASVNYAAEHVALSDTRFSTNLVQLRVDGSFSTRAFLNAFIQYDTDTRQIRSNVRFNVIHHPLSDLYLVYNDTSPLGAGRLEPSRALILKLTHLLAF